MVLSYVLHWRPATHTLRYIVMNRPGARVTCSNVMQSSTAHALAIDGIHLIQFLEFTPAVSNTSRVVAYKTQTLRLCKQSPRLPNRGPEVVEVEPRSPNLSIEVFRQGF